MSLPSTPTEKSSLAPRQQTAGEALLWILMLGLLWTAINPGDLHSWLVGIPVVAFASAAGLRLHSPVPRRYSLLGAVRLTTFLVDQSFRGGWDVAKRALLPAMSLNPAMLNYPLRLRDELAQVLLVNLNSLLPGTLSADLVNGIVTVHVLDAGPETFADIQTLEERVAGLFSIPLDTEKDVRA
jgi:multicomponent Na+:H+ antiporter subunit E